MTGRDVHVVIADSGYEMLSKQLQGYDGEIQVVCATDNGSDVYEMVQQHNPDVLVIDVFITNVDGLEVVEQIRMDESLVNTKIIFLTTVGSPRIISMAFNLGADYYIMKPCNPDILAKRIMQIANIGDITGEQAENNDFDVEK